MSIEGRRILVIVDSEELRALLIDVLTRAGAKIDPCANGLEGLKMAGENTYDLVLTDILMPETDGISVIRTLKDKGDTPPILVISGGNDALPSHWLLKITEGFGADGFIHKPFEPDELITSVCQLLGKS